MDRHPDKSVEAEDRRHGQRDHRHVCNQEDQPYRAGSGRGGSKPPGPAIYLDGAFPVAAESAQPVFAPSKAPKTMLWCVVELIAITSSGCLAPRGSPISPNSPPASYRPAPTYGGSTNCYNYGGGTVQCDTWDPNLGRSRTTYCITMPSGTVYCSYYP